MENSLSTILEVYIVVQEGLIYNQFTYVGISVHLRVKSSTHNDLNLVKLMMKEKGPN